RARFHRPQHFIAFSFDLADRAYAQLEPVDLAKNLRLDVSWQRASVSGPQFFQTFPAVLVQRIIVGGPLAKQQSSNAVRVLNALPQQRRALARDPTAVLFARVWRHGHGTAPRLAALPGHQRAQQRLAVDRIGLGAPVASRHGNRGRIDDVALDAIGLEQAMNPETIKPDFLDRYNLDRRCDALLGSALQPRKKVEQFARVTAGERVLGHLAAAGHQRCCNPCRTLLRTLMAWQRGEPRVCAMTVPPSPSEEDRRRVSRERATLLREGIRHTNRIRGLLFGQGITNYNPLHKNRRECLEELRTGDGRSLPAHLKAEVL